MAEWNYDRLPEWDDDDNTGGYPDDDDDDNAVQTTPFFSKRGIHTIPSSCPRRNGNENISNKK